MAMQISFPLVPPEYCARDFVLAFPAIVEHQCVQCAVTAEALQDYFGAASLCEEDLIKTFNDHRTAIERVAQRMLKEVGGKPILLHSGFFRFCSGE